MSSKARDLLDSLSEGSIDKVVKELDAINNINIKKQAGEDTVGYVVKGTDFALDRAKEILKNLKYSDEDIQSGLLF